MALTLQRKLELAGALSKVQPLLQRLHILEKPKHRRRNRILVVSTIAAGAVVAAVAYRRRGCRADTVAASGDPQAGSPEQTEPGREGSVPDPD